MAFSKQQALTVGELLAAASFETDIRPLFTHPDIEAMSKALDLTSCGDVKAHWAAVDDRIRGVGRAVTPPPGKEPWPQSRIDLFARRIADGYPC
jgi:hypothetical protein